MKQPLFVRSVDTETLIQFIRSQKDEPLISYAAMCKALRRSKVKRPTELSMALKALLDEQLVFETVMGDGIKLATPNERLELSESHINRTRRATKRVMRKIATVNPADVDAKNYASACARVAIVAAAVDRTVQKGIEDGNIKVLPNQALTRQQLAEIYG